jgi:hypothetical protein
MQTARLARTDGQGEVQLGRGLGEDLLGHDDTEYPPESAARAVGTMFGPRKFPRVDSHQVARSRTGNRSIWDEEVPDMLDIDRDRREHPRVALQRPCKVFDPRSRKYLTGVTSNISAGGVLMLLSRRAPVQADDCVYVAVAERRRQPLLRRDEMCEARVVRTLNLTTGETALAVRFLDAPAELALPHRMAA